MLERLESIEPKAGPLYALAVGKELTFVGGSSKYIFAFPTEHLEFPKFQIHIESSVYALHFVESTQQLWVAQSNGELAIIDIKSKSFEKRYQLGSPGLFSFCVLENEMLVGGGDGKVSVWDLQSHEFKRVFTLSDSKVRKIIPSGRGVFCSFSNGDIEELDLIFGNRLARWKAHSDGVFALATHPTKPVLFSGGKDGMIRAWNAESQALVIEFPAHESSVYDIVFASGGEVFITAGRDKKIKEWSAKNLEPLYTEVGQRSFNAIQLGDQQHLFTVGDDGQLSKWAINVN